jgi:uncharacterized protein YdaU (DUF1376 family)
MDLHIKYTFDVAQLVRHLYQLSKPDSVNAYTVLWMEYFYHGKLPSDENKVRLLSCTSVKKWPRVRDELMRVGFTEDWRNPKWDEEITAAAEKKLRADARKAARKDARPPIAA